MLHPHTPRSGNARLHACAAFVFTSLAAVSQIASAQLPSSAAATPLPAVVVTGSRTPTPIAESIADVSIISREELATAGQSSLVDVLRRQRGIEFITTGGPGSTTNVHMRGASGTQVLLLIDGQRVGSSSAGAASWQAIPLEQIERIEVLRGPASSLYGADAIGGVVQIFTRRGEGPMRFNAEGGRGSYDTWRLGGGVTGSNETVHYGVQLGAERSGGFNAIRNPSAFGFNPDRDGYRSENASGQFGFKLAPGHELGAQFLESRIDSQYDTSPNFDDRAKTTVRSTAIHSTNRFLPNWTSRLRLGETADLNENRAATSTTRFDTKQRQYAWQNDFSIGAGKLQLAAERREERVASTTLFSTNQRDTNSGIGVVQWAPGMHLFQGSMRLDDSNQFGRKTTGALAYGYRLGGGWRATVSGGTAFRAPTFNDLYFPGFDNPTLVPEKARNGEGGVHYEAGGVSASAVYYRNRVENLITFQGVCPLPGRPFGCPVNVNKALLEGVSMSASARLSNAWSIRGTFDIADPHDRANGRVLPRRAKQYGSGSIDYASGPWSLSTEVVATGKRFDDVANTRQLAGYGLMNLVAGYRLNREWRLFARWNNVFDKQYELAANFATPGSNVFVGVRYQ